VNEPANNVVRVVDCNQSNSYAYTPAPRVICVAVAVISIVPAVPPIVTPLPTVSDNNVVGFASVSATVNTADEFVKLMAVPPVVNAILLVNVSPLRTVMLYCPAGSISVVVICVSILFIIVVDGVVGGGESVAVIDGDGECVVECFYCVDHEVVVHVWVVAGA
jgi:hypothetical protein